MMRLALGKCNTGYIDFLLASKRLARLYERNIWIMAHTISTISTKTASITANAPKPLLVIMAKPELGPAVGATRTVVCDEPNGASCGPVMATVGGAPCNGVVVTTRPTMVADATTAGANPPGGVEVAGRGRGVGNKVGVVTMPKLVILDVVGWITGTLLEDAIFS